MHLFRLVAPVHPNSASDQGALLGSFARRTASSLLPDVRKVSQERLN